MGPLPTGALPDYLLDQTNNENYTGAQLRHRDDFRDHYRKWEEIFVFNELLKELPNIDVDQAKVNDEKSKTKRSNKDDKEIYNEINGGKEKLKAMFPVTDRYGMDENNDKEAEEISKLRYVPGIRQPKLANG